MMTASVLKRCVYVIINKRSFESVMCLGHDHANFAVVDTPAARAPLTQSPSALTIHGGCPGLVPAEQSIRDDRKTAAPWASRFSH